MNERKKKEFISGIDKAVDKIVSKNTELYNNWLNERFIGSESSNRVMGSDRAGGVKPKTAEKASK